MTLQIPVYLSFNSAAIWRSASGPPSYYRRTVSERRDFTQSGRVESDGVQRLECELERGPVRPTVSQEIPRIFAPQLLRGARLPILSRAPAPAANSTVALAAGTPTTVTQRIPRRNPVLDPIPYERNLVKQHGTLGCVPKERALGKRPNRGRNGGGQLLPNLLPLPTKSILKQMNREPTR